MTNKRLIVPIYIIFVLLVFAYVKAQLKLDPITVEQKEIEETTFEVKPVDVVLSIDTPNYKREYKTRLKNVDTVLDLLNNLRDNQGLTYEVVAYTYGTDIEHVNKIYPPEGYYWEVYYSDTPIKYNIQSRRLEDGATYILTLEESTHTEELQ